MSDRHLSSGAYFWAHLGTIMFHLILALVLLYTSYKVNFTNHKMVSRYVGFILGGVSILALIPIFKTKDEDITIS